jgi:hypothetical protein
MAHIEGAYSGITQARSTGSASQPSHRSFAEKHWRHLRGRRVRTVANKSTLATLTSSATMATSDYQPDKFESQAPPMFNPFNSTPPGDVETRHEAASIQNDRKRKRQHPDHASVDFSHHGGFNSPNSPVHSNPDLDSYIKSRRKPREKKACQVCRCVFIVYLRI